MNNILLIARREYVERVRRRSFWLLTILMPLLLFAIIGLSTWGGMSMEQRHQQHPEGSPYAQQIEQLRTELQQLQQQEDQWAGTNDLDDLPSIVGLMMGMLVLVISMTYGSMVLSSILEEKQNRLAEILVTSVSPGQLLAGKIFGILCVALTQLTVWCAPALLMGTSIAAPMVAIIQTLGLSNLPWAQILIACMLFFLLGFLLNASLSAIAGSMVDDETQAKQVQSILTIVEMIPLYINMLVLSEPDGMLARVLSYFPLTAPCVMPIRICMGCPAWEWTLSLLLMALTVWLIIWMAGRIYRTGLLMYGKKATLREVLHWLKQ